jgi:tripartite-type tricarboxylate transporter receptor subunit TctC
MKLKWGLSLFLLLLSTSVLAQPFPSKVVKIVVAYAPGGATDVVTRAVAQRLSPMWGQPVVIENKPGANTNIATADVAKAPADGYTLLSTAESTFAVNPYVYAKLPYDPVKDYVPVSGLGIIQQVLAVHPGLPYNTVGELIAAAKAQPGKLNYAAFGPGSSPHLNMEMLLHMAGAQMTPVHYKGGGPALTDVIGGHVSMIILSTTLTAKPYRAGQLKILGVGSPNRLAVFPEVPTIAESGLPGYEAVSWFGLFAPAGTPREVVSRINTDVQRVLADADFREKFLAPNYFEPVTGTPEQFAAYVKREADKWAQVIKAAKITVD